MTEYINYIGLLIGGVLGIVGNYWGHYLIHQNEFEDDFFGISIIMLLFGLLLAPLFGLESLLAYTLSLVGTVFTTIRIQNYHNNNRMKSIFFLGCSILVILIILGIWYQIYS